jgi:hypothetical protein
MRETSRPVVEAFIQVARHVAHADPTDERFSPSASALGDLLAHTEEGPRQRRLTGHCQSRSTAIETLSWISAPTSAGSDSLGAVTSQ